jgi:hypothetical protein
MTKLEWALAHARRGFSVFPLIENSKRPKINNWTYQATKDEARIKEWWGKWPDANIAIYAGGMMILDVDPRKGGHHTLAKLGLTESFPNTLMASTAGGGIHIYYTLPKGVRITGGNDKLGPGIDVKTDGGYVVAPGSTIDNRGYAWKYNTIH